MSSTSQLSTTGCCSCEVHSSVKLSETRAGIGCSCVAGDMNSKCHTVHTTHVQPVHTRVSNENILYDTAGNLSAVHVCIHTLSCILMRSQPHV